MTPGLGIRSLAAGHAFSGARLVDLVRAVAHWPTLLCCPGRRSRDVTDGIDDPRSGRLLFPRRIQRPAMLGVHICRDFARQKVLYRECLIIACAL